MPKRLVRFDWAMKKLLRNKANFSILEGFFSELLRRDITIQNILESESNKQTDDDKYNRVDLLALADDGELLLIELQVEGQFDYFHRMLFGTSKLITDYMVSGLKYREVRKVISINIVPEFCIKMAFFSSCSLLRAKNFLHQGLTLVLPIDWAT